MPTSTNTSRAARSEAAQKLKEFEPKISYRPLPATKEVEITMVVNEQWGAVAIEVLRFMSGMVGSIARYSGMGYRDMRVAEILAEQEREYQVIRERYQQLRMEGFRHRETIRRLVADPSLPFHDRWKAADFNWCVRVALPSRPILKRV